MKVAKGWNELTNGGQDEVHFTVLARSFPCPLDVLTDESVAFHQPSMATLDILLDLLVGIENCR